MSPQPDLQAMVTQTGILTSPPRGRMGWSPTLTWLRWGPRYHLHRRVLQPAFAKSNVGQYIDLQRREALIFCQGMIQDPTNWANAVRRCSVAMVLKIAYGLDVEGPESKWIGLAENSAHAIGKAGAPGSSILDLFPASELVFLQALLHPRTMPNSRMQLATCPPGSHLWSVSDMRTLGVLPSRISPTSHSRPRCGRRYSHNDSRSPDLSLTAPDQASHLDRRFFTHNRLAIYKETSQQGLSNEFSLEDIKGAAATVLIAGNDTVSPCTPFLLPSHSANTLPRPLPP